MFVGTFVGITEHLDPGIRRLGGCKRDAQALHAIFVDSIPSMRARLVLDAEATINNIRDAITDTLGAATEDDIVVFTFSGHGTKSHRLVAFDTNRSNLDASTFPMQELADAFKQSKARTILCILDCCFSGGAPGKVLEDSPDYRDLDDPLVLLVEGKGRYLLAACNSTEVAYESPTTRHGFLTKAVVDVFCSLTGEQIDLPAAVNEILKAVQTETARRGLSQTPTFLGHVEGGLLLPALRKGEVFFKAFPDARGAKVTKNPSDLTLFGIPSAIANFWSGLFRAGLNDLQLSAVNDYQLLDGESLIVIAPTSSGKTFIGEMAAIRAALEGRRSVFLLPYRALVNEKFEQFSIQYRDRAGLRVIRCSGDYSDEAADLLAGKYDLALLTYEMFLGLVVANPTLLNHIGLVVIDEAQFITDPSRGISVELILTFLLAAKERGLSPQVVALSAVIGDTNSFDEWLGVRILKTDYRPVPLIEGVIDRQGIFKCIDENGNELQQQLLQPHEVRIRGKEPSAQDLIVPLVQRLVSAGEKVLVFRNQRGAAQGCAGYLARDLGIQGDSTAIAQLPHHDSSSTSSRLRECMTGGTAFHNSNLSREEREIVERVYRDPSSNIRVLAATTTVAAGINTPATTVIIAEQEFIGEDGRPFTVAEYKNMAGRAGRVGFNERGRSIIYAENSVQREQLFRRYVCGQVEALRSSFDLKDLNTWVVRLLAQTKQIRRAEIVTLLCNTYGGFRALRSHPDWKKNVATRLDATVERMLQLGLLEQEGGLMQLTLLGRACRESSLSFESSLRLVGVLRRNENLFNIPERILAAIQVLEEMDAAYTPMFKKGVKEHARAAQASSYYGAELVRLLQQHVADNWEYLARCKRACVLWEWIQGTPIEQIEERYTVTPYQGAIGAGDIRRFADTTRFHLRSALKVLMVLFPDKGHLAEELDILQKRLEFGLPTATLPLLEVGVSLNRGECLALSQGGIASVNGFWSAAKDKIVSILGSRRAVSVESGRPVS